jgi:hypothetical protein
LALLDHTPNASETVTTTGWLLVAIIVLLAPIAIAALLYVVAVWHEVGQRASPTYKEIATSSLHKTGDGRAKKPDG